MTRAHRWTNALAAITCCIVAVCASACTDDEPGGSGPPIGAGGDLFAIIESATAKLAELQSATDEELVEEMRAWLTATGAFAAVGVARDASVWARLPEGELLIIVVNPRIDLPDEAEDDVGGSRQELRSALPQSVRIFAANADDSLMSPAAEIRGWATANGYADGGGSGATIEELELVDDAAVFYIDSHGGIAEADDGHEVDAFWTRSRSTEDALVRERARLRSQELVVMLPARIGGGGSHVFGVTGEFVRRNMSFADDSFVFVNACSSSAPSLIAGFRDANASVYAGWTITVLDTDAARVGRLVLDRMLGANQAEPRAERERRPYPIDAIREELRALGWNPARSGVHARGAYPTREIQIAGRPRPPPGPELPTELVFTHMDETASLALAPSLASVIVNEGLQTLTAYGAFGSPPYDVWLDGQRLTARSRLSRGSTDEIVAELPPGAFSGPVYVENAGRRSNAKMLSGWTVGVRWTQALVGSVVLRAECELRFRAMPRGVRVAATDDAVPIVDDIRADLAPGSSCTLSASGSETWTDATGTHTAVWSPARTEPFTETDIGPSTYLGLAADGAWSLHIPLEVPNALVRTIDGTAQMEPWGVGAAIGEADTTPFDPERFDLPGGTARNGDVEIEWDSAPATPTPEDGEGLTPSTSSGGGGSDGGAMGGACAVDAGGADAGTSDLDASCAVDAG